MTQAAGICAGMVPGQEHFQKVQYKLLDTPISTTMTLPALVRPLPQ